VGLVDTNAIFLSKIYFAKSQNSGVFGSVASASLKARLKSRFQKALNLGKRLLKGFLPLKDVKKMIK